MGAENLVLTEVRGRVGLATLNRPQALNALSNPLVIELMDALEVFDEDAQVGAMVITGDERAFAAGADIKEMAEVFDGGDADCRIASPSSTASARSRKPVIAAVSGWCLGGGNELALSCDLIVASETARFGQPEINIGVIPGAGGTQRLTRAVGKALAMEMVLNNRTLTAEEALQLWLVNRVVPVERLPGRGAWPWRARSLPARRLALRLGKEAVNNAFESSLTDGIADERRSFYLLVQHPGPEGGHDSLRREDANPTGKGNDHFARRRRSLSRSSG